MSDTLTIKKFHQGVINRLQLDNHKLGGSLSYNALSTIAYIFANWKPEAVKRFNFQFKKGDVVAIARALDIQKVFPLISVLQWRDLYRKIRRKHGIDTQFIVNQNSILENSLKITKDRKLLIDNEVCPTFYIRCL